MKYSQNDEEGVINSLFGDTGRFLDVGAFDGKTFSNTLKLYERGWSGVLVEPSPLAFAGLQRQYVDSTRVTLVNAAIADSSGKIRFFDSGGDAISSTDVLHKAKWEAGYKCKFDEIEVDCLTWKSLFNIYCKDMTFDFVNIDTESTNLQLLKTFPFDKCLPMCMCIEYDSYRKEMMDILSGHGYREVYCSGENIVVYRGPR